MNRRLTWYLMAMIVAAGAYVSTLRATPANVGFSAMTIARAQFDEIDVHNFTIPANFWQGRLKTHGLSDVYVQSNAWAAGGSTGWHTHPGHSLILVTAGTITAYESDDPTCAPHVYTPGMGIVDEGGQHVHVLRNEDPATEARTIAVQLIPAGATRRIDAPAPAHCPPAWIDRVATSVHVSRRLAAAPSVARLGPSSLTSRRGFLQS